MLEHSFVHIPTIGLNTEKRIWSEGILSLDEFLMSPPGFLSPGRQKSIAGHIRVAREKLDSGDAGYFCHCLPASEQWRIFKEYRHSTAYIDIETTGLGGFGNIITTIALYDGQNVKHYIQGVNLEEFIQDLEKYKVIVSYNGKSFDVPFIENYFGISMDHAHLDLRYILRSLGYGGGLKSCEHQLGIGRTGCLGEVDGYFAVLLWYDYQNKGNEKSLETLLAYNIQDVLNLERLMIEAYNQKTNKLPLPVEPLKTCAPPANPFTVDLPTVERIKQHRLLRTF